MVNLASHSHRGVSPENRNGSQKDPNRFNGFLFVQTAGKPLKRFRRMKEPLPHPDETGWRMRGQIHLPLMLPVTLAIVAGAQGLIE
jgi:hypothetical protein